MSLKAFLEVRTVNVRMGSILIVASCSFYDSLNLSNNLSQPHLILHTVNNFVISLFVPPLFAEPEAKKACSTASGEASLETKDSKKNGASESPVQPSQLTADVSSKPQRKWCYGSHRAGFDAFMTGFFFASCLQRCSVTGASSLGEAGGTALSGVVEYENKVALSGKPQPLQLVKSHYATNSPQHVAKWAKLTQGV